MRLARKPTGQLLSGRGLRIIAHNNFVGRANPTRIFAGQTRGGLTRFATPNLKKTDIGLFIFIGIISLAK